MCAQLYCQSRNRKNQTIWIVRHCVYSTHDTILVFEQPIPFEWFICFESGLFRSNDLKINFFLDIFCADCSDCYSQCLEAKTVKSRYKHKIF